jgi:anti-sigma B factor antagonist
MSTEREQLQVHAEPFVGGVAVVRLDGELDPHSTPVLQRVVDQVIAEGATRVTFHLADLRFIDSSGLRVLIATHRRLLEGGGALTLAAPSDTTRRLLEITGLHDHFEIIEAI